MTQLYRQIDKVIAAVLESMENAATASYTNTLESLSTVFQRLAPYSKQWNAEVSND